MEDPREKTPDHPQTEHTFLMNLTTFSVSLKLIAFLELYFLCDHEFGTQFHSLCSVVSSFKCLVPDIVDKYKCVFTCIVLTSIS